MHHSLPSRHLLALALGAALAAPLPVLAQQVIADGDDQTPAAGDYHTTDPVEPGNPAGHAFHALNGGTIVPAGEVNLRTEGMRAAAARVEGAGSRIELAGGSITTTGYGAAGVSVTNAGTAVLSGTRIETEGTFAHGIEVNDGSVQADNLHITTRGGSANGLDQRGGDSVLRDSVIEVAGSGSGIKLEGGTLLAERVRIEQGGAGEGVFIGNGSDATLRDVQISGTGAGARGIAVGLGKAVMENVDIVLSHERSGMGLIVSGGEAVYRGGRIHALGENASAIQLSAGGTLALEGVDVQGHFGIYMREGTELVMRNSHLSSERYGVDLNFADALATIEDSSITVHNGTGIAVIANSQVAVRGSSVKAGGDQSTAVSVLGNGQAVLTASSFHTTGANSHGLHTFGNGAGRPQIDALGVDVLTEGESAYGAIARKGGSVNLRESVLRTQGMKAHGVLADGSGEMNLIDSHVHTEGEDAWGAVVVDGGKLQIDGGSLVSAQAGGVWVRSSREPGLTLSNGAVVQGGNGIGLALDAAVAGRFDVALEGGSQMIGDIVITPEDEQAGLVPQSQVHVRLADGALWQGASDLVQTLVIEGGSQWTLGGDATVGELQVRDSTVALSDGTGAFNTLTVEGNLHTEGATLWFNGALEGDDSRIDQLHVRGDTHGDAQVRVDNIGGVGAPTVDGIPLIHIDGDSLAQYRLAGRAVGGSYEYFLFQGGLQAPDDGHWYLRSQWFDRCATEPAYPGCVIDPDPEDGGDGGIPITPPVPVLRPEVGAYLANQSAAVGMFAHRMHERRGADTRQAGRSAWVRVGRQQADFSAVGRQLAVDGNTNVVQVGSDLLGGHRTAFGVMVGSGRSDSTAVSGLTGYRATGRVRGTAVGVYGSWLQQPGQTIGAYLDGSAQWARFDNRVAGDGLLQERYDSKAMSASLEAGYTFAAWQGPSSTVYLQPQLQLSWVDFSADAHVEQNGTRVDAGRTGHLAGRVGLRVFGHGTPAGNVVQPYAGMSWLRGSATRTLDFNGETLGADVPRNRYEVQVGAELTLRPHWSAWAGMAVQHGDGGYRSVGGQLGIRRAW